MDKFALFEIGTTHIRLTLCKGVRGEYFYIYKTLGEHVHINEAIAHDDGMIKSAKFYECSTILKMYKRVCEAEGVKNYLAVAAESLNVAKNCKSFIDELGGVIGCEFKILSAEAETNAIYSAVVNSLDIARGVIVNVSGFSTRIIHYSRRMILDAVTIPYGSVSLFEKTKGMAPVATDLFQKELTEKAPFLKNLDPETQIVGVGDVFTSYGRLARKMKKYPYECDHNYVSESDTFYDVFNFIKGLDMDKKMKLKGVSNHSARTIMCGMCIVDAVLRQSKLKAVTTATAYRNYGIMCNHIIPSTVEKPISDLLSYGFNVITNVTGIGAEKSQHHYELALMLYKNIRVLHKLPRNYAKPLHIASSLYNLAPFGDRFHAILDAPILGASHKDIVLAAFAASFKKWEDFNLGEWIKYKDMMTDEDLEAVRKLANILTLTEQFDIRGGAEIKDISCDMLGESVILKLVTTTADTKKVDVTAADVEIFHARKYAGEFQRTFKRSLELL
jgi:exopolyphosphatase/guanosine-5'-triphosphate,3'-diphosphate pyrophosphatase